MSGIAKPPSVCGFSDKPQVFETERLTVVSLSPFEARNLLAVLLQDEALASQVPWMKEKSQDNALQEAFCIDLQCAAGQAKVWSIIERERRTQIGAIVARDSLEGLDVEVLVASQFWGQGVADEAGEPVMEWLADNNEVNLALQ
ncbi:hypothetical protein R69746_08176 [Paraburkholderia aspalathi]|uniref:GNAT family N-acetyltransferase n=1 Tax=Paraburkholderia aspalathi TaxID=1324617 RepID=UPI00190DBDC7|nr:GNAT family N-acetyltransferase [Paraburkholderia aspalathi]MBK3844123.1 GNAT family N-acetyltransferase [Paraburkholderia aspalathi]CAE6867314.1 hypothetical protein R69746_08176 [Paraburkholderia aspalathi]